jgi:hypothetical protein
MLLANQLGINDVNDKAELGAKTREGKSKALSWNQLRAQWDGRLTREERRSLAAVHRREHRTERPVRGEKAAVDHALEHCEATDAVFTERKLFTEALKKGIGSVTIKDVKREIKERPLVRAEMDSVMMVTTPEMKQAEARLLRIARAGRGKHRPMGDPKRPCRREWLNDGQKAAVAHALGSRDFVMLIRGPAGRARRRSKKN